MALRSGPLISNLESMDRNGDAVLAAGSPLRTQWDAGLLGGVMTIRGTCADGTALAAVPNHARLNRAGRSLVWLRDQ